VHYLRHVLTDATKSLDVIDQLHAGRVGAFSKPLSILSERLPENWEYEGAILYGGFEDLYTVLAMVENWTHSGKRPQHWKSVNLTGVSVWVGKFRWGLEDSEARTVWR
jgi:hypothetical protein